MLTPAMAVIVAFWFVPIALVAWISLHRWSMFTPFRDMRWEGLGNYAALWRDPAFWEVLQNTAIYCFVTVGVATPLALLLAMLLYFPKLRGRGLIRTLLFATYVVPVAAVAIVWSALYAPNYGPLTVAAEAVGLGPVNWLTSPDIALLSLAILDIWRMLGYYTVLFVAGLTLIPGELFEAAQIDGAGPIRQALHVTIPLLSRTTVFVVLIGFINAVQVFDPVYLLTQGGPSGATNVASFDIQRTAFQHGLAGRASAEAFTLFLVIVAAAGLVSAARRWRAWR